MNSFIWIHQKENIFGALFFKFEMLSAVCNIVMCNIINKWYDKMN